MDSRLDELIAELRKRYDYIIADNVPVGIIADASIANRIADLTVFVLRRKEAAQHGARSQRSGSETPGIRIRLRIWLRLRTWIRLRAFEEKEMMLHRYNCIIRHGLLLPTNLHFLGYQSAKFVFFGIFYHPKSKFFAKFIRHIINIRNFSR